ncbi:hypothetical protein WR25_12644 [Diploscapter pachys]|uniref:Uncharacterized protein n=1 Tax=Diploscapter pachys TaxID=2018661 RepID=A0A2A2L3C5_9BILA|nr:hypothetical protein WR25_12644 [Diploscapter pachys]
MRKTPSEPGRYGEKMYLLTMFVYLDCYINGEADEEIPEWVKGNPNLNDQWSIRCESWRLTKQPDCRLGWWLP